MMPLQADEKTGNQQERTMADIQIEYSHLAAQLGDRLCKLMVLEDEVKGFKATMLSLNEEAKKLSKLETA